MTFEEVATELLPDLETVYTITLIDQTSIVGPIEGPYRGNANSKFENRLQDYIYVWLLNHGLTTARLIPCSTISTITVID